MGRGVSAISVAALALATLLGACGGGNQSSTSSTHAAGGSSTSTPAASATATVGTAAPPPGTYWPYAKVLRSLAGRTIVLPRGQVHLDSTLMECNGDGTPVKTGPTRRWDRYTCTQTLFENGVDRDVTFDVTVLSATRLSITAPRYGSE